MRLALLLLIPSLLLGEGRGPAAGSEPAAVLLPGPAASGGNPYAERYLSLAQRRIEEGDLEAARRAVERVLESDDQHLTALEMLAGISSELGDADAAVYAWHRWMAVVDAANKPPVSRKEIKGAKDALLLLDPKAEEFRDISVDYVDELLSLAKDHLKKKRQHAALAIYQEILVIDPLNAEAEQGLSDIRRKGTADVATEDLYAGTDPTQGVSPEWIAEQDKLHDDWDRAWQDETENYRYKTNSGYLVLKTSSIAMEQMNRAYRQFFRYKLDGDPTPKIDVIIYKNRDLYLEQNNLPENDWTGGFFNGGSVQTFMGGRSGKESLRDMYGTLFHEAAHQFVSLTGKGGVPGWMNEGYASFFEGTVILSNGSVKWNQVPPGRLFPLAGRMERGWMESATDLKPDEEGNWATPERSPTFRQVVAGGYRWGPPWYAPTWGVIYFLYNYRDEVGRPVYRDALHRYYLSGAAGRGDGAAYFEEVVLATAPLSPVKTIDELNDLWREWILDLREIQIGNKQPGKSNLEYGDLAWERGDIDLAMEFYEEAYAHASEDPETLWKLAVALEDQKSLDRAAALYRDFAREVELRGLDADERYPVAREKMEELDPLFRRQTKMKEQMLGKGLELAQSYLDRDLPTMALEIARRMSSSFSMPEAIAFYERVARESGVSLARWRIAYNEYDLQGWSGSDAYEAYGSMVRATIVQDKSIATNEGTFQTQELACDVTFDADFSLEAEMQFESDATLMGLCFGRKDGNNTHAVVMHPKGYLDISTKNGGIWSVRDHRAILIDRNWQKLRIDVVADTVDVYLNDRYLRSMKMPSRDSVRGAFGLITGVGTSHYRNIRLLARNPYDPAARIEREIALQGLEEGAVDRPPGTFTGIDPAGLQLGSWLQGDAFTLEEAKGRPLVLAFWSVRQDELIPTAEYYQFLHDTYAAYGYRFLVVASRENSDEEVSAHLAKVKMRDVPLAMDANFQTFEAYNLKAGGWELPRILVIDVDGRVIWEGDPGLKMGVGWVPGSAETFLDGPLDELFKKRHLEELKDLAGALEEGEALHGEGRLREALAALEPLADLDAAFDEKVRAARDLRARIEALGHQLLREADRALEAGYPLRARALVAKAAEEFSSSPTGDQAAGRLKILEKDKRVRSAVKAWRSLEKGATHAGRGRDASYILPEIDAAQAASNAAEVQDAAAKLKIALLDGGPQGYLEAWETVQPDAELAPESEAAEASAGS